MDDGNRLAENFKQLSPSRGHHGYKERCVENCPAAIAGKPLSPAMILQKILGQMENDATNRHQNPSALTDWAIFKNPPDYQPGATPQEQGYALSRRVLGLVMVIEDIDILREGYEFFLAHRLRDGGNKNARADNLGVSRPSYSDVDAHLNDVAGIISFVDDKKGRVWDSVEDEWEV